MKKMKRIMEWYKNLSLTKKIIYLTILFLILIGSIHNSGKGTFWPFYSNKVGDSYGINFALISVYSPNANHYGLNLVVATIQKQNSSINGVSVSVFSWISNTQDCKKEFISELNGVEISLFSGGRLLSEGKKESNGVQLGLKNWVTELNGVQLGIINFTSKLNGIQLGVGNFTSKLNGVQLGGYNRDSKKQTILINYDFKKNQ